MGSHDQCERNTLAWMDEHDRIKALAVELAEALQDLVRVASGEADNDNRASEMKDVWLNESIDRARAALDEAKKMGVA